MAFVIIKTKTRLWVNELKQLFTKPSGINSHQGYLL